MKRALQFVIISTLIVAIAGCADEESSLVSGPADDPHPSGLEAIAIFGVAPNPAKPGETVTITGQGLDASQDKVLLGNVELAPAMSAGMGFLAGFAGQSSSGGGGLSIVVPMETTAGELPVRVVRGDIASNIATLMIAVGDGGGDLQPDDDPESTPDPDSKEKPKSGAKAGLTVKTQGEAYASGGGFCQTVAIEWALPASVKDATLYFPMYATEMEQNSSFSSAFVELSGMITAFFQAAGDPAYDASNYWKLYEDARMMCGVTEDHSLACKPAKITEKTGTITTVAYTGTYRVTLVYTDATGDEQKIPKTLTVN